MYGRTVLGVDGSRFDDLLTRARSAAGVATDAELDVAQLQRLTADFRALIVEETGQELPQDARVQLREAVRAVFRSWNGERARLYRAHEGIADDLGTAVNVVQMVFGNRGDRSGSGVCFTRDPVTGAAGAFGDYLPDAQGEDVVSGVRSPMDLVGAAPARPGGPRRAVTAPRGPGAGTTATSATWSSPSSGAGCGSSRPGWASAARPPPSGSRSSSPTRGSSTSTKHSPG